MDPTTTTFQSVARELSSAFELRTRRTGQRFVALRDDAPTWIRPEDFSASPILAAHVAANHETPDNWVYDACRRAADMLADCVDWPDTADTIDAWAESAADAYTCELFRWAASPANQATADEAAEDVDAIEGPRGPFSGTVDPGPFSARVIRWAQAGQALALLRIAEELAHAIRTEAARRDAVAE